MLSIFLLLHVCAAVVGLISGFLAMFLRKGSGRHGAAGTVFFVAMLVMSSSAVYLATFVRPIAVNRIAGLLTFYLVATAWWAARRRDGTTSLFDVGALLFVLLVAATALTSGIEAASSPTGRKDQMPAFLYFAFGTAALISAASDIRMLLRGGVSGARRIARHLLRMGFTLLIATFSFYPGQAKLFPVWLRETNVLWVPHVLLLGSMLFWTVRIGRRRRTERATRAVKVESTLSPYRDGATA